jgi:hypothetical protein
MGIRPADGRHLMRDLCTGPANRYHQRMAHRVRNITYYAYNDDASMAHAYSHVPHRQGTTRSMCALQKNQDPCRNARWSNYMH